jgi:hypothetical protein
MVRFFVDGAGTKMRSLLDCGTIELGEAERRVGEFHSQIQRQRELIEVLRQGENDLTSAWTVYESLLVSLSLSVGDRHRLRTMLARKSVETIAA